MANFNDQLQRMKSLMTYGAVNEKKEQKSGAMEYHAIGADGKSYGIIRENQKFYIKVAPKNKEMVAEAYDYIGGFNNKKAYEYTSYSNALKNFELKMISIKEAHNPKVNIESLSSFEPDGEVMTNGTKEMMAEIARQRQIMNNVAAIMNESTTISAKNVGTPEAPKTAKFNDKIGKPFEETAKAELDGDFKKTSNNPEKQGAPFGDTAKVESDKDAEYVPQGSVANQKPKGGKVVKVNESAKKIFEMMAKLDKTFTLNESCEDWASCGLPSDEGVGSPEGHLMEDENIAGIADDNFEETDVEETDVEFDDEMMDSEGEDEFDFEDDEFDAADAEDEFDFDDDDFESEEMPDDEFDAADAEDDMDMEVENDELAALRDEIEALRAEIAELKGEDTEDGFDEFEGEEMPDDEFDAEEGFDEFEDEEMPEDEFEDEEMPEDEFDAEEDMDEEFNPEMDANYDEFDETSLDEYDEEDMSKDEFGISESRKKELLPIIENLVKNIKKNKVNEEATKLNDFGKHPGYRKKPMTLPQTGSDKEGENKDWNDESVYSEQPFGSKIGDSAPYDKLVQAITNSVMESITGKKKI